jgi:carbonic anhydrase/acetyltransferase-like protein (isoleucine patch superfamily)
MTLYALGDREPDIDPDAYVHPDAVLIGSVIVKAGASIWPGAVLRADDGPITVGERTSVQDGSVLHVTTEDETTIGADSLIGHLVHLEGCAIGEHVLVGSGSTVLNGARVESGALIAARAVVGPRAVIPAGTLARGVPARVIEGVQVDGSIVAAGVANYVERARRFRAQLRRLD